MPEKIIELPAIKETTAEYEQMESRIKAAFKRLLYGPILRELGGTRSDYALAFKNARSPSGLSKRLASGQITYSDGAFRGTFDASTSRELRDLGAKWDNHTATWKLAKSKLPLSVRSAISTANVRYQERLKRIDRTLAQISPAEIADAIKTSDLFLRAAIKTDALIAASLKGSKVSSFTPKLSAKEQQKIADEWQDNMDLWIKNFTEEEIARLRKDVAKNVTEGNRHEALVQTLQRSYGVTERKAKFLARQETSLLMAKFKETRYTSAGVHEYRWTCVAGSPNHPVRPSHKILEGKIYKWQDPPITTPPGESVRRNNPGQDYNCRCSARPIVRF